MNPIIDGGPAFPHKPTHSQSAGTDGWSIVTPGDYPGMSLRDYFAAKWMQGWIACPNAADATYATGAKWAYEMADAMLEARAAIAKVETK